MKKYEAFDWSELPALVIEKIYSFLNRTEQAKMSLVCRNWRKEYSSPNLWRRLEFNYPIVENKKEPYPEVIFARRYGNMCHHVEISFKISLNIIHSFPFPSITFLLHLEAFMEVLARKSQLLSISFENMLFIDDAARADLYQAVLKLMRSQKKLQYVRFRNYLPKMAEKAEILNVILENNYKTLRYLHFYDSVNHMTRDDFANITVDDCLGFHVFMNLEMLTMDYTQMFEKLMVFFYKCSHTVDMKGKKGRLKQITLFCYRQFNILGLVNPVIWEYFKNVFPGLRVHLYGMFIKSNKLSTIIVPHMPLRSLRLCLYYIKDSDKIIGPLLRYITSCGINKYLEKLSLRWNISPNLSPDLINFTDVCPKLKVLELAFEHPVQGLYAVFNSWSERRSALVSVKITVTKVKTEEEKTIYTSLNDIFAPFLQKVGIELSLYTNPLDEILNV